MSKKISYCKRALVLLIAFMMIFTMMPSMAFAESDIDNTVNSSGNSITVYASVTLGGELQKAKDDTYMAYKAVTVTDKDSDGKMTLHDMMLCLHEQYYPAYSAENIGYVMATGEAGAAGKGVTSFWGKNKTDEEGKLNKLFIYGNVIGNKIKKGKIHNLDTGIAFNQTEVSDGIYISISDADSNCSNSFGSFNAKSQSMFLTDVSVPKNTEIAISLYNVKVNGGIPTELENYGIYILSEDGKHIEELTDADGNQVLTKKQDTSCY